MKIQQPIGKNLSVHFRKDKHPTETLTVSVSNNHPGQQFKQRLCRQGSKAKIEYQYGLSTFSWQIKSGKAPCLDSLSFVNKGKTPFPNCLSSLFMCSPEDTHTHTHIFKYTPRFKKKTVYSFQVMHETLGFKILESFCLAFQQFLQCLYENDSATKLFANVLLGRLGAKL